MAVNEQILKGNWNIIKGRLRERWGQLSGQDLDAAHGNVEQLVGMIQRQTGEARESVEKFLSDLTHNGHSNPSEMRRRTSEMGQSSSPGYSDAAAAAQQASKMASDSMRAGWINTQRMVRQRPMESLAVCFGVGVMTGVIMGLITRSR